MSKALGLVETKGLIGAIEAADAMAKAANVTIVGKEITKPAMVTIKVVGETAAVKHAVEAGAYAAQAVGQLVALHVIPQPDDQLSSIIPEISEPEETPPPADPVTKSPRKKKPESAKSVDEAEKVTPLVDSGPPSAVLSVVEENQVTQPDVPDVPAKPIPEKPKKRKVVKEIPKTETYNTLFEQIEEVPEKIELPEEKFPEPAPQKEEEQDIVYYEEPLVIDSSEGIEETVMPEVHYLEEDVSETDLTQDILSMNVHQLRRLARSIPDFPIKGREISKANRTVLLDFLKGIK